MQGQIRQGDVLLVPVDEELGVTAVPHGEVVLAYGEVTGHAHRLSAPTGVYEWHDADGNRYVRLVGAEPGSLYHEDHDPTPAAVVEPEQTYRVVQQGEWDLAGQWRQVVD